MSTNTYQTTHNVFGAVCVLMKRGSGGARRVLGCEGQGAGNTVATLTVAAFCWGSANYPVCSLFIAFLWGAEHNIVEQKVSGSARRVVTTHQCPRQGGPQRVPKTQGTTNPRPSSLYHTRSLPLLYVSVQPSLSKYSPTSLQHVLSSWTNEKIAMRCSLQNILKIIQSYQKETNRF